MTTRMTINGVSTCQTAGTEKYEKWKSHSTLTLLATQDLPFWLKYD